MRNRIARIGRMTADNCAMKPGILKFGVLFAFWFLGAFFGAGVVDLLWARRDGDHVRSLAVNLGALLLGTVIFFVLALRKPKSGA